MSHLGSGRSEGTPSPALLAAQTKLQQLRQQQRMNRSVVASKDGRLSPATPTSNYTNLLATLPSHLGWHSDRASALWRPQATIPTPTPKLSVAECQPLSTERMHATPPVGVVIKLYPDLALAWLKQKQTAVARIWLLLRHLDKKGQGWLSQTEATQWLTDSASDWRVCGKRQLRNLWAKGDGLFWHRQNGRIWLCSIVKVATASDVVKLTGNPIALPATLLTDPIGKVRAHFYASFHSGRRQKPIARATLTQLCAVPARTQRRYEKESGVKTSTNFALGPRANSETKQREGWQRGTAIFEFTDSKGIHGAPNQRYLAWQLPNSYQGPHHQLARGQQKRFNQQLTDLPVKGMAGNGQLQKRFYGNGQAAVREARRQQGEAYWPEATGKSLARNNGRFRDKMHQLWYYLPE